MHIVTLFENSDRDLRISLDRYVQQLLRNGEVSIWNTEQVLPGEEKDTVCYQQLEKADLVLLLISQDFLADQSCYDRALQALEMCRKNPAKKMASVLLRPSSIADTPLKDLAQLPLPEVCITQYKDPEQGFWDAYQGIKKIINPNYRYKKRPKIAALQATLLGSAVLLLWCLFVLLLPVIYPQDGIRIVPEPFFKEADSSMYYKIYKLDQAAQDSVVLFFSIEPADTNKYGQLQYLSAIRKKEDANWVRNQMQTIDPDDSQTNENGDYFSQCVRANFNKNDEGEYHFNVQFSKPIEKARMADFEKKLRCGHTPCYCSTSNCENVGYFSAFHYFYFRETRFYTIIFVFILTTLLLTTIFSIKKASSYAKRNS